MGFNLLLFYHFKGDNRRVIALLERRSSGLLHMSPDTHREVFLTGEDKYGEEEQEMGPLDLDRKSFQRDVLLALATKAEITKRLARKIKKEKEDYFCSLRARGSWSTVHHFSEEHHLRPLLQL